MKIYGINTFLRNTRNKFFSLSTVKVRESKARIIDGKKIASKIRESIRIEVEQIKKYRPGFTPHLVIIQVGNKLDSTLYIKMKRNAAEQLGIKFSLFEFPETVSQRELLTCIGTLNKSTSVHGILLQLPLPRSFRQEIITDFIDPRKDVDGFHSENVGLLTKQGTFPWFESCTPKGIMELLREENVQIEGKHAVIVGRSNIVGRPLCQLLNSANATTTLCHSYTTNLSEIVKYADILVVAIGKPEYIKGDWIKDGAVVIDVGMTAIADSYNYSSYNYSSYINPSFGFRWVGDVEFEETSKRASLITPVPGGVGPMTVAMVMKNVVLAAKRTLSKL
jgi:methylenetetrahydrofolate dehydrogenase (NADP+)/methenyltetrahydrofolate cyclohydrolase/formyltetrahydrofolate synthetase